MKAHHTRTGGGEGEEVCVSRRFNVRVRTGKPHPGRGTGVKKFVFQENSFEEKFNTTFKEKRNHVFWSIE